MPEEAIEYYETASRLDPSNHLPQFFIGLSHKAKGRYEAAMLRWQKCLDMCPKSVDTQLNMGNLYFHEDLQKAEDCYQKALEGSLKYALYTTRA